MRKVRIGLLGCANIAERIMLPVLLQQNQKFHLCAIASRSKDKARLWASRFGCKDFGSYDELLDEGKCDAIYIPLPNSLHYEFIRKALERGIHVLVEKSMTCSLGETKELNELAKKSGLVLVENFQFRFHKQLAKIIELMNSPEFGEIRAFSSTFSYPPFKDESNIRYSKILGGGALLDAGAYPIKLAQIILGENIDIESASYFMSDRFGVDLWGGGSIRKKGSAIRGHLNFGMENFYRCDIELLGSKGRITTNRIYTAKPDTVITISFENDAGNEMIEVGPDNSYENMLNHFWNLIEFREQKLLNIEYIQNVNQARLLEEFRLKANG